MRLALTLDPRRPQRQQVFGFIGRSRRHERWFKGLILAVTCVTIVLLGALPRGRYLRAALSSRRRRAGRYAIGLPTPREEIDDSWRRYRLQGIADASEQLDEIFAEASPETQRLMRYAGLDPECGLLRWGNYNRTLLLPSKVIEADDTGRSYRLRPNLHSVWLRNVSPKSSIPIFFLVPDDPGLAEAIYGTPAIPVEASRQTTNSWGLRGPEPDPQAPLRVIVLGDSFMQGLFIGDDETPPECLRHYLEEHLETRVSVLNTGVLGHSPEQYYYSLLAFIDRFRPHAVVVSTFTNDFGGDSEVPSTGEGDWDEGKYWLDKITQLCRSRQWPHLIVPVPYAPNLFGRRKAGYYPGILSNILEVSSFMFVNPAEDFINAHLELTVERDREGEPAREGSLFNSRIGDGHFSALGSQVWASTVGRRLILLLERDGVWKRKPRQEFKTQEPGSIDPREQGQRHTSVVVDDTFGTPAIGMGARPWANPPTEAAPAAGLPVRRAQSAPESDLQDRDGRSDARHRGHPALGVTGRPVPGRMVNDARAMAGHGHDRATTRSRRDRRRLAAETGIRHGQRSREAGGDLRRVRRTPTAIAPLRRDGPWPRPASLGKLRSDRDAAFDDFRIR